MNTTSLNEWFRTWQEALEKKKIKEKRFKKEENEEDEDED